MKNSKPKISLADRKKVSSMKAGGMSLALIAKRVGCTVEELEKQYAEELARALPELKAMVGARLFNAAKNGNVTAIIFWLKTRAGWRETVRHEIVVPDQVPLPSVPRVQLILPCNGRAMCRKIMNAQARRAYYEEVLGRKLPDRDPSEYLEHLNPKQREDRWQLALDALAQVNRKANPR